MIPNDSHSRADTTGAIHEHPERCEEPTRAVDAFDKFYEGSSNIGIDPSQCVPLVNIRDIAYCGVEKLAKILDGSVANSGMVEGHTLSGALPIVVKLHRIQQNLVTNNLIQKKGMDPDQANEHYNSKQIWYGIVDDCHRHAALCLLIHRNPQKWMGYSWWITVIEEQDIHMLKAFTRDRDEKQRKECIVDLTRFDTSRNMKDVARRYPLCRGGQITNPNNLRRGLITEIADMYCGGKNQANSTSRRISGVVLRLSDEVIACIGEIMNTEYPDLAIKLAHDRSRGKRVRVDSDMLDTRVFRTLLNTSTLRSANLFKNADQDCDRIYALRRCRFRAVNEGHTSISGLILNEEVENAKAARKEVEKMNKVLGGSQWPLALQNPRINLLETTQLHQQVKENLGEDLPILPRLRELYTDHGKFQASQTLQLFAAGHLNVRRMQDAALPETSNGPSQKISHEEQHDCRQPEEGSRSLAKQSNESSNTEPNPEVRTGSEYSQGTASEAQNLTHNLLDTYGISTHNTTWQKYEDAIVRSGEELKVDMILSDPPYGLPNNRVGAGRGYDDNIDEKEMELFSQFARHVLVPGGYFLLFTSFHMFPKWKHHLESQNFVVAHIPLLFVKKTSLLQRYSSKVYPQSAAEFGVLGRLRGTHRKHFEPNFRSPYGLLGCSHSRRFSIVDGIPPVRSKLLVPGTKRPVRIEEKILFY